MHTAASRFKEAEVVEMDFIAVLEKEIEKKSLLKHPFYVMWQKGELPKEALKGYAEQYHKFTENFPRYVAGVYAKCEDTRIRRTMLNNLIEEEAGNKQFTKPHAGLWMNFSKAVGGKKDGRMYKQTISMLDNFEKLSRASLEEGAAALLAYEAQIPAIAKTKMDGLKKFYGIKDRKALEFFRVHMKADIEHQKVWKNILRKTCTAKAQQSRAVKSVRKAMNSLWLMLNGVCMEYGIECHA